MNQKKTGPIGALCFFMKHFCIIVPSTPPSSRPTFQHHEKEELKMKALKAAVDI
jgi:hypothetical protein